jgi:hypothetical protein
MSGWSGGMLVKRKIMLISGRCAVKRSWQELLIELLVFVNERCLLRHFPSGFKHEETPF